MVGHTVQMIFNILQDLRNMSGLISSPSDHLNGVKLMGTHQVSQQLHQLAHQNEPEKGDIADIFAIDCKHLIVYDRILPAPEQQISGIFFLKKGVRKERR